MGEGAGLSLSLRRLVDKVLGYVLVLDDHKGGKRSVQWSVRKAAGPTLDITRKSVIRCTMQLTVEGQKRCGRWGKSTDDMRVTVMCMQNMMEQIGVTAIQRVLKETSSRLLAGECVGQERDTSRTASSAATCPCRQDIH